MNSNSSSRKWHKPNLIAWVMTIGAVCLMAGLSIWQFERLGWKEALITRVETAAAQPASGALPAAGDMTDRGFYRYRITGKFMDTPEYHLAARYYKSQLGYHLLSPFVLNDGRILIVNRGWVPVKLKEAETRPESGVTTEEQTIIVMLRTDRDHTMFTPKHDIEENIWFWRDVETMRQVNGLDLLPITADWIAPAKPKTLPVPAQGEIKLRNDHLGYALTWLMIGIAALVIFILYHYRPADKTES